MPSPLYEVHLALLILCLHSSAQLFLPHLIKQNVKLKLKWINASSLLLLFICLMFGGLEWRAGTAILRLWFYSTGTGSIQSSCSLFNPPASKSRCLWFRRHMSASFHKTPPVIYFLVTLDVETLVVSWPHTQHLFSPSQSDPQLSLGSTGIGSGEAGGPRKLRYLWWDLWSHWPSPASEETLSPWICRVSKTESNKRKNKIQRRQTTQIM